MPPLSSPLCCQTYAHTAACYAIDSRRGAYVIGSLAAVGVVFVSAVLSLLTGTTAGVPAAGEATPWSLRSSRSLLCRVEPIRKAFRKRLWEFLMV